MSVQRIFIAAACAGLFSAAALAHPKLVSSVPANEAEVESPPQVELTFNEKLVTQFSGAKLTMTGMPGMAGHAPMAVAVGVSAAADPNSMVITPKSALPAGTYRLDWRAVSTDTHPVTGTLNFKVK
jgi:methionine-rich copper-binding protein CopC